MRTSIGGWLRLRRALLAGLVLAGLVVAVGPVLPAAAHARLLESGPADGSTATKVPAEVTLRFSEPVLALGAVVVVTGPAGPVQVGAPRLVDTVVRQEIAAGAPAGTYRVQWRVTSGDGHPISGEFGFVASGPGGGTAAPDPTTTDQVAPSRRVSGWLLAALVLAVLGGSVAASRRLRRRS